MRWVAKAPTSWLTSDGNADRVGVFCIFALAFSGWVADCGKGETCGLLYG